MILDFNVIATVLSVITNGNSFFKHIQRANPILMSLFPFPLLVQKLFPFPWHSLNVHSCTLQKASSSAAWKSHRPTTRWQKWGRTEGWDWRGRGRSRGVRFGDCIHHLGKIDDPTTMGDLLWSMTSVTQCVVGQWLRAWWVSGSPAQSAGVTKYVWDPFGLQRSAAWKWNKTYFS